MTFKQAKEIAAGFTNLLKMKMNIAEDDVEKIALLRNDICKKCTSHNKQEDVCKECGCYLPAKTRSLLSSCPNKYWTSIL